jgi:hypothetical protein
MLWLSAGMAAREVLPDSLFPKFGNASAPRGRPLAPPQVAGPPRQMTAGTRVQVRAPAEGYSGAFGAQKGMAAEGYPGAFGAQEVSGLEVGEYVPQDPALPMDPDIDPEVETAVLKALEWEDDRQLDGFAQSISHPGNPFGYGYYPIAASYLRYRAKIIREAREALAKFEAEQAVRQRVSQGVPQVPAQEASPSPTVGSSAEATPGTTAPAAQAPPPSSVAVPGVRVKLRRPGKLPAGGPAGARGAREVSLTAETEPPPPNQEENGAANGSAISARPLPAADARPTTGDV